ncbi:hypothetical protein ACLMJK_001185 [Lecanora helva]
MGLYSLFPKKKPPPAQANSPDADSAKEPKPLAQSGQQSPAIISSRGSVAPSNRSTMAYLKFEVMANFLSQEQLKRKWIRVHASTREGCFIRRSQGDYVTYPSTLAASGSQLATAVSALNPQCAITVASGTIQAFLDYHPDATSVPLDDKGLSIQVMPTLADLPRAQKLQYAAFIASEGLLVVWDDEPMHVVARAENIEGKLTSLVWNAEKAFGESEGKATQVSVVEVDPETGHVAPQQRKTHLMNTILIALTLALIMAVLGAGYRAVAIEIVVDKNYLRLAFLALTPVQVFFTLFFAQVIIGCIAQMIGPCRQMKQNSRFYSAKKSPRLMGELPHITIQCPVYKEGLAATIAPTIRSIKAAISTYELQGGSANMFINDDGLQLIDEEERQARIDFYADHGIGWTARPKVGAMVNGKPFERRGKFKKASNMNYGLMLSCRLEELLHAHQRHDQWTEADEKALYEEAVSKVLKERPEAWSEGNIRIGDYILLIDSDTRVPTDCLLDAASEMHQSPDVGILQFSSGVMQISNTYFENGITFFTNLIYSAIRYTVANGDVAPFVGHNAILRWEAVQQVTYTDDDGYEKFWAENMVSEDFDMSLRLQCLGYIIRLATWAGDGFKEGVSLTVYDELARWEKYAYGCNELLFHPIVRWPLRGPFTPLFRRFLFSNIRFTSKITIVSYIGTYYAIGAAWIMTTANYFAIGWFNGYLDKYYIDSWKVWFSIVIVFNGLGNFGLAAMRYRDEDHFDEEGRPVERRGFFGNLLLNFKHTFLLSIFLGGLSLHISAALLSHMFSYPISWGATAKEIESTNFFLEVPKIAKRFKFSMCFALVGIATMIVLSVGGNALVPWDWHITDFVAILPMATVTGSHLLLPIVLNPGLMTFSW